jgi:RNA polymerase sigma-70 factor (ECF subfamily)
MLAVNLTAFMASESPNEPIVLPPEYFATTHWTVVLAAQRSNSTRAHAALSSLCQAYWYPLYAFVRRRGFDADEAQDLTQEFFARLLEKNYLQTADRQRGRFRTFLLAALSHFLDNHWDRKHRVKRGGRLVFVSFEELQAEQRYALEPSSDLTPEKLFDRRWALTVLEGVHQRLRKEYVVAGKAQEFQALQVCLSGEKGRASYAELGEPLGMSEGAVKVAVHRLRRRFGELLRAEIAQTVARPEEVDEEIRHLFAVVGA